MADERWRDKNFRDLGRFSFWLILGMGLVVLLVYFKAELQPLVVAVIIWYLVRLVKDLIGKIHIRGKQLPKLLRNVLAFILIAAVLAGVSQLLIANLNQLISRLPQYQAKQEVLINQITRFFGAETLDDFLREQVAGAEVRPLINGVLNTLTSALTNILIVVVYTIFLILEEDLLVRKLAFIRQRRSRIRFDEETYFRVSEAIRDYISVKTFTSFLTAALSFFILLLLQVELPFLWAFLVFLLNFIPYVGSLFATLMPSVFSAVVSGSPLTFLYTFLLMQIPQFLVANIIEPRILGRTLNLSPLVVILSLTFWAKIWGIWGMLIAVPITSILVIILAQFPSTLGVAVMLSADGNVSVAQKPTDNGQVNEPQKPEVPEKAG